MARGHPEIQWIRIRTAFVLKGWSAQKCADEFGVDVTTIKKRCSKERWVDERHRNATAATEIVTEELREAAVDEIREHAQRITRALRLGDLLMDRFESALTAVPVSDSTKIRGLSEGYQKLVEALSRGQATDRLVRGVPDGKPSDAAVDDGDGKIDTIQLVIIDPSTQSEAS